MNLSGKKVAIAGHFLTLDTMQDAKQLVTSLGGKVAASVSGKTDYLLLGADGGAKQAKAAALNTPILRELDLLCDNGTFDRELIAQGAALPVDTSLDSAFDYDAIHLKCLYQVDGQIIHTDHASAGNAKVLSFSNVPNFRDTLKTDLSAVEVLSLGVYQMGDLKADKYTKLLLDNADKFPNLRFLAFQAKHGKVDLSDMLAAFPNLEGFYSSMATLTTSSPVRHHNLVELRFHADPESLEDLFINCSMPRLEKLTVNQLAPCLNNIIQQLPALKHFGYSKLPEDDIAGGTKLLTELPFPSTLQSIRLVHLGHEEISQLANCEWWQQLKHLTLVRCSMSAENNYLSKQAVPQLEKLNIANGNMLETLLQLEQCDLPNNIALGFANSRLGAGFAHQIRLLALNIGARFIDVGHNCLTAQKQISLFDSMPCKTDSRNQDSGFY